MKILISESQYRSLNEKLSDISGEPIYHYTNDTNALRIIYNNTLKGSVVAIEDISKDPALKNSKHQMMVSFTRNKNFVPDKDLSGGGGIDQTNKVIFVVDKNKLKTRYKVLPFDYWDIHHRFNVKNSYSNERINKDRTDEMEERVLTDAIEHLGDYLIDVQYNGGNPSVKHVIDTYKTMKRTTPELREYIKINFPILFGGVEY